MKKLLLILLLSTMAFGQQYIMVDSTTAQQIKGRYGIYSEIDPIKTYDGKFIVPTDCLSDKDLAEAKAKLQQAITTNKVVGIPNLPSSGTIYKDSLYLYNGVVKCRQTHTRTIYPPEQTPALFSFYRENSDTLSWIENEEVQVGWKRVYNGITYRCLQSHFTLSNWQPPNVPALWVSEAPIVSCPNWVQPTGAQDAYNIGDCVTFNGSEYESLINANVWSPTVYPAGWRKK